MSVVPLETRQCHIRPNKGAQSDFLKSTAPYPAITTGLGGGKTWAGSLRLLLWMIRHPGVDALVVEPTYDLINQIAVPAIRLHLKAFGMIGEMNHQTMEMRIPSLASKIIFKSGMKAERITGIEVGYAWIDEPARIQGFPSDPTRDCYTNVIARVRDPRVTPEERGVCVTGTHEGVGTWFHDRWERDPLPGHVLYRGKTTDNKSPGIAEYAKRLEQIYGPELARQYVDGYAIESSLAAIPYSIIVGLQDHRCTAEPDWRRLTEHPGPLSVGMDIGRTQSLTVFWIVSPGPNDQWITEAVVEMRQATFREQFAMLEMIVRLPGFSRMAIDSSFNPATAEDAINKWGAHVIEGVQFTSQNKVELAQGLIAAAQDGRLRIPESESVVADFHSVKRTVTGRGVVQYHAAFSADGHADRFWAATLALRAARRQHITFTATLGPKSVAYGARAW
jgi:hypothetical protein